MLSIRLLGTPEITIDQRPITITRRKSRAILYYVAAHPNPLTRDRLLAFFWPDFDRQTAQQNLRVALSGLRKALGTRLIVDSDALALAEQAKVDTRIFEARISTPSASLEFLQQALDLYQDDFLSGFTLPNLPEFDDWATVEREHYHRLAVRGLIRLGQLYEARRDFRAALEALDQALAFDPLQEDLQRLAMRMHYRAGNRAGAIRRYENFRHMLAEEMGVPPMDETRNLYDGIITDTLSLEPLPEPAPPSLQPKPPQTVGPSPFVGREAELRALNELATSRRLVLIEGEAGIGKSRLVEQFIQAKQKSNVAAPLALTGQARELESILPYQPIIEALRSVLTHPAWPTLRLNLNLPPIWQTEAARLLPELTPGVQDPATVSRALDEIRLWEGVSQFLLALAGQMPLILALDDLHWADSSTLGLLGYLIRKAGRETAPISFVATTRQAVPGSSLMILAETLLREARLERLTLDRLTQSDIALYALRLSSTHASPLADWLSKKSEGNPFFLTELVRYARDNQFLFPDGKVDLAGLRIADVVPQTVYRLIRSHLARLSEASWQVLSAAVVIGREFEFEVVAHAVALSDDAVLAHLDELQSLALVHPLEGSRYVFDHHLTLEVAAREIGEPRRRLFHRRVAEALEIIYHHHIDTVAGLLAHHFAEGGVPQRAAKFAFRAGQQAVNLAAWNEAIAFYDQSLAQTDLLDDQSQRQAILVALGQACMQAGDFSRASEVLFTALDLSHNPIKEDVIHLNLTLALLFVPRYDEVLALADMISESDRPENGINAEYLRGVALGDSGLDLEGAIAHLQKAEDLLSQQGMNMSTNPAVGVVTSGRIKYALGNMFAKRGDLAAAVELYRKGIDVSRPADAPYAPGFQDLYILFHNNLAYHLYLQNDPTAAEYARRGLSLAQETGFLTAIPFLLSTLGEIALAENDLVSAEQYFGEGLSLAKQFSVPERIAGLTASLGLVAERQGQRDLAVDRLSTALAQAEELDLRYLVTQIRVWFIPLLPSEQAQRYLTAARLVAKQDGYQRLLDEIVRLEAKVQ
ncbi:MAG: AAA family ATPase [Chloroflexi bacterium]|nr:AAA family ATPase [Chloroflexota bacterium]